MRLTGTAAPGRILKGDGPEEEFEALERLAEGDPGDRAARRDG